MLRKLAFALGMSCLLALPSGASEPGGAVSGAALFLAGDLVADVHPAVVAGVDVTHW